MRRLPLILSAALFVTGLALQTSAQNAPNQPVDPQALVQQALQNMQNQGITPEDVVGSVRQQMQDGTFNPQGFMQQLQDSGIVDQNMMNQIGQLRNQLQQRVQQRAQLRQPSNLQILLNSPDDEWAVLSPKIQRILDMTNDLNTNIDTPRTNNASQQTTAGPAATALYALGTLLNTPDTPDAQIAAKLAAYRATCQTVRADLSAARADLLQLLTLRQESILLNMQLID